MHLQQGAFLTNLVVRHSLSLVQHITHQGCDGSAMLDCDDCHRWFHEACVGIRGNDMTTWYCDECVDRRQFEKQQVRSFSRHVPLVGAAVDRLGLSAGFVEASFAGVGN